MSFSSTLKRLRDERQVSQKDLAEYLGITRQAIASYESGKREPDYTMLKKLADYFSVSVDFLLGRSNCRDENAFSVASNIRLIRGDMTYLEMSEDISRRTGALIYPEMLELYENGERMPFVGTLKILSTYAQVHDHFFYSHNTYETLQYEQELYRLEAEQAVTLMNESSKDKKCDSSSDEEIPSEIQQWVMKESSEEYLLLAKELQEAGIPPEALHPLIKSFKGTK